MAATLEEIQAMESFFEKMKVPKVFKLHKSTTINDLPAFINKTLENVKNPRVSETVIKPRWDDLVIIRSLLGSPSN